MAKPTKQLRATLEAYERTAKALDSHPLDVAEWRLLLRLGREGNALFVKCGGKGEPFKADTEGLDVFFILRRRELCAAIQNPQSSPSIVRTVSHWLGLEHIRQRVEALV